MAGYVEIDAGPYQWSFCPHCQSMQPPGHWHASDDPEIEGWSEEVDGGLSGLDEVEGIRLESYRFVEGL
jgi:hypothetical protein